MLANIRCMEYDWHHMNECWELLFDLLMAERARFPAIAAGLHTTVAHVSLSLSSFFIGISAGQFLYIWRQKQRSAFYYNSERKHVG